MRIGILSDTHDELERTRSAVQLLIDNGSEAIFHCGDLTTADIVRACAKLPFYFCFGNHDCDSVPDLEKAAEETESTCLRWGGEVELGGKRIAVVHGHLTMDLKPLIEAHPDYLLSGHWHFQVDQRIGPTRRINPGALFRAEEFTVAVLDLESDELSLLQVE